ncbi:MAG: hypothetical protein M3353_00075 [Actinomycetota bacterium]|nr:hypothetical protein [Actinomycetota bacterium]
MVAGAQVVRRPAARRDQPRAPGRLSAAGAGPADLTAPLTMDLDSTIVEVYGRAKQGAAFGYTKVRGYHRQLATCAQTGQVLMSRLRGGPAGEARGAASCLTETIQPGP